MQTPGSEAPAVGLSLLHRSRVQANRVASASTIHLTPIAAKAADTSKPLHSNFVTVNANHDETKKYCTDDIEHIGIGLGKKAAKGYISSENVAAQNLGCTSQVHNSISLMPKKNEKEEIHYIFKTAACQKPHPHKKTQGEDAWFFSSKSNSLGIADGVGGWTDLGIDSGLYSRKFMSLCREVFEKKDMRLNPMIEEEIRTMEPEDLECEGIAPEGVLQEVYDIMESKAITDTGIKGSTTCCIVKLLGRQKKLRVANLGDSGMILLRKVLLKKPSCRAQNAHQEENKENIDPIMNNTQESEREPSPIKSRTNLKKHWKVVFRTEEQQHYFNCPRQIGTDSVDKPLDCDRYEVSFVPGDLAICLTDGVLDNLSLKEIATIANELEERCLNEKYSKSDDFAERITPRPVRRVLGPLPTSALPSTELSTAETISPAKRQKCDATVDTESFLQFLADKIATEAFKAATDPVRVTPFEKSAFQNGYIYNGGKIDDITVVVARVTAIPPQLFDSVETQLNFDEL